MITQPWAAPSSSPPATTSATAEERSTRTHPLCRLPARTERRIRKATLMADSPRQYAGDSRCATACAPPTPRRSTTPATGLSRVDRPGRQRARVQRLVQPESSPTGQVDGGDEPPALLRHTATELDAPGFELANGGLYVVAHEIQLIAAATRRRRVRGELGRGEREDEPAVSGVNRSQPEDVGEEGPVGGRGFGVEDRVNAGDRHQVDCFTAALGSSGVRAEYRNRLTAGARRAGRRPRSTTSRPRQTNLAPPRPTGVVSDSFPRGRCAPCPRPPVRPFHPSASRATSTSRSSAGCPSSSGRSSSPTGLGSRSWGSGSS